MHVRLRTGGIHHVYDWSFIVRESQNNSTKMFLHEADVLFTRGMWFHLWTATSEMDLKYGWPSKKIKKECGVYISCLCSSTDQSLFILRSTVFRQKGTELDLLLGTLKEMCFTTMLLLDDTLLTWLLWDSIFMNLNPLWLPSTNLFTLLLPVVDLFHILLARYYILPTSFTFYTIIQILTWETHQHWACSMCDFPQTAFGKAKSTRYGNNIVKCQFHCRAYNATTRPARVCWQVRLFLFLLFPIVPFFFYSGLYLQAASKN